MTTMKKVKSSNIAAIGYNAEKFELLVEFKSGKTFGYKYVSSDEYKALLDDESVGKHFNAFIKGTKVAQEAIKSDTNNKNETIASLKDRLESAIAHIVMIERIAKQEPVDREISAIASEALEIDKAKSNV